MKTKREFMDEFMKGPIRGMGVELPLLDKDLNKHYISIYGTNHIFGDTSYDTADENDLAAYLEALKPEIGIDDPKQEIIDAIAESEGAANWAGGKRFFDDEDRITKIINRKLMSGFHKSTPEFPNVKAFKEGMPYYLEEAIGWRDAENAKYNDDGTVEVELPGKDNSKILYKYKANIKAPEKGKDISAIVQGLNAGKINEED